VSSTPRRNRQKPCGTDDDGGQYDSGYGRRHQLYDVDITSFAHRRAAAGRRRADAARRQPDVVVRRVSVLTFKREIVAM